MGKTKVKPSYRYKALVERVIDGDTIDVLLDLGFKTLRRERIRFYGVNTPESRTMDLEEKKRGLKAKAFVYEKIQNQDITMESVKQGKFGRYLGKIYLEDGTCLNDLLIKEGHGVEYFGGKR